MAALSNAFAYVFSNLPHLFATAILTLFALSAIEIAVNYAFLDSLATKFGTLISALGRSDMETALTMSWALALSPSVWGMMVVGSVLSGMFAVRWHRSALFGSDAEGTGMGFELSLSLGRYVLFAFLITIISMAMLFVGGIVLGVLVSVLNPGLGFVIGVVAIIICAVFSMLVAARLSLCLPAIALNIPDFGLVEAWRATRGHGWGILGALLVATMAAIAVSIVAQLGIELLLGAFLPEVVSTGDPVQDFADATITAQQFKRDAWVGTLGNAIALPFAMGVITSLWSFIYFQIGKPPHWVEKQRIN